MICKKNNFLMALIFISSHWALASVPVLKGFVGQPSIELVDGQVKVALVKDKQIEQTFIVKTSASEQAKFGLGKDFELFVLPESKAKIEGYYISKTEFQIKAITFEFGRFYLKNGSSLAEDLNVTYQSDFFIWKNTEKNNQREFFLELNSALAQVRFCAGAQGLSASIWDHEVIKKLKFQEGASFQGALKDGALAFDLLLENRKIPKGDWQENFTCDFKQILKEVNEFEAKEAVRLKHVQVKQKSAEKKRKAEYDKSVCHEPNAQFNECLWKYESKTCVRYRCDGQGQWQDRRQLPKNQSYQCETKPRVAKCDY